MLEKTKEKLLALRNTLEVNSINIIPNSNRSSESTAAKRLEICRACDLLYKPTDTCKKCGCFMVVKTNMKNVKCPIDKWGPEE